MSVVLMYHSICNEIEDPYIQIRIDELARQLGWVLELGYRWGTLAEAVECSGEAVAAVTFDDGLEDFLLAIEVIEALECPVMQFICPGLLGGRSSWTTSPSLRARPLLNLDAIQELAERGVGFSCHGWTHRPFPDEEVDELERQLLRCREWFSNHLDEAAPVLAYPYGRCDPQRARIVAPIFPVALAVDPLRAIPAHLAIPRVCGTDGMGFESFRKQLALYDLSDYL